MLRKFAFFIFIGGACVGCGNESSSMKTEDSSSLQHSVVYGDDSRKEISFTQDDQIMKNFSASPAVFTKKNLTKNGNHFIFRGIPLGEKKQLCDGEKFAQQLSAARCSAVLIGKKIVLTAGHCVTDQAKCDATAFVFGWKGQADRAAKKDVYGCKRWISGSNSDGSLSGKDYSLLELEREVENVEPIPPNYSILQSGDSIYTIGYPNGISAKLSEGVVTFGSEFLANATAEIDGFTGNSGGGVFDRQNAMGAIYSSGEIDFEYDSARNCHVVKTCRSGSCMEEFLLQLSSIRSEIESALK